MLIQVDKFAQVSSGYVRIRLFGKIRPCKAKLSNIRPD
jgi:hypothetical protein